MRFARRLSGILIGCATWCVLAATAANASMLHDPVPTGSVDISTSAPASGTPFGAYLATAALAVLVVLFVLGLVDSLKHPQRSIKQGSSKQPSRSKRPLNA